MTEALAIRLTADADDATRALDGVGDAAARMASGVDTAVRDTDRAVGRMDGVADAADNMASRSSQAAGGIGDLGGALSMMPGPLGAVGTGMETLGPAIMGVTGASDLANLAMTSTIVTTTKARAAALKTAVASRVQAGATRAAAVAQRVLNLAMRANPVGLVVTAVMLLVGAVVLAYKRSETFRRIVHKAMAVAKAAVMAVVDVVSRLVGWVKGKLTAAWVYMKSRAVAQWNAIRSLVSGVVDRVVGFVTGARDRITSAWDTMKSKARAAWDGIRSAVDTAVDRIKGFIDGIQDKADAVSTKVKNALGGAFDWVRDKVQPIIDAVQSIIDKLDNIKLPSRPGWLGGRAVVPERTVAPGPLGRSATTPTTTVHIKVEGAVDPRSTARQIRDLLALDDVRFAR